MTIVCLAIQVYTLLLFLRIVLSWVTMFTTPPAALSPVIRVIYDLTEPVLGFFRRYIPPIGMFDISVLFVFIILRVLAAGIGC